MQRLKQFIQGYPQNINSIYKFINRLFQSNPQSQLGNSKCPYIQLSPPSAG